MSFDKKQFRRLVNKVLLLMGPEIPYSRAAEELLLMTAAQETHLGKYIEQIKGPAKGVFQMEPQSWRDVHVNYLMSKPELLRRVDSFYAHYMSYDLNAVGNLPYQIAQARVYYRRVPEPLPELSYLPMEGTVGQRLSPSSVEDLARYWKKYWNTYLGKGTVEEAIQNYERFLL